MATPAAFQVPPIDKRKRIPMKTIRAIAEHIARKFDPDQIILFGSHAYGKPSSSSDVDLLVVMATPMGEVETGLEIMKSLPKLSFHVDVIARPREVIERRKEDEFGKNIELRRRLMPPSFFTRVERVYRKNSGAKVR